MSKNELEKTEQPGETGKKKLEEEHEGAWQPQLWSKIIVLGLIVGYGVALVVANSNKVKISFLITSVKVSLVWLILLCFAIGLLSGVLVSQMHRHRKTTQASLKQQAEQAKQP
jgi:uncharacterized integral membrane protein